MDLAIECALFVVGLAFGSFLNVCISRIPRDLSIVSPPSHCPRCGRPIAWFDNIPVLSWLVLKRSCRDCHERISWRYPAVELLIAALFATCYVVFGPTWATLKFAVFCFLLVGLIFMDAETGLLPREFTYTGTVLGLILSLTAFTDTSGTRFLLRLFDTSFTLNGRQLSLLDSFLGALLGAFFFYLAWAGYFLIRRRHGMGFGDIALMAMSGAFLGLKLTVFVLFTAPLLGLLYALVPFRRHTPMASRSSNPKQQLQPKFMQQELPLGVFLGICSLVAVFAGQAAWRGYLRMLGVQ